MTEKHEERTKHRHASSSASRSAALSPWCESSILPRTEHHHWPSSLVWYFEWDVELEHCRDERRATPKDRSRLRRCPEHWSARRTDRAVGLPPRDHRLFRVWNHRHLLDNHRSASEQGNRASLPGLCGIRRPRQFFVAFGMHFLCTLILQSAARERELEEGGENEREKSTFASVALLD